jgi:hypothetical protein
MVTGKKIRTIYTAALPFIIGLLLLACQKLELTRLVKIKTGETLNLTAASATLTGELIDAGESGVLEYGICWSTEPNPVPDNSSHRGWGWTADSQSFQTDVMGLIWNTTYYFRAYCMVAASEYILGDVKSFATPYDAVIRQLPAGIAPAVDGNIDEIWSHIEKHYIERNFYGTVPTIDSVYWQGAWNAVSLFILIAVYEDIHIDRWDIGDPYNYNSDLPEIYIDVNSTLKDGWGPEEFNKPWPHKDCGHYQFNPAWTQNVDATSADGIPNYNADYYYGYCLKDPDYVFEYSIDWNELLDKNGIIVDPMLNNREFGFDVAIIDRDFLAIDRSFKVWRNAGGQGVFEDTYDYFNMDGAGVAVLSKDVIK